jgi:hypothetical protein
MKIAVAQQAFENLAGGTFVGLDTLTKVPLKGGKKNIHQGRVTKHMTGATVMCFTNQKGSAYEAMVRRRLEQEGRDPNFEVGPRAWGTRITGTPFVEHRGEYYLEVLFLKSGDISYLLDGLVVAKSAIQGLESPAVSENSQGGLENRVQIRSFSLESVLALRANGREWK